MKKYLVFQHGKCTIQPGQKIKVFDLPPGVKVTFLTRPAKTGVYSILRNYIEGKPTHLKPKTYNRPGALVPNLYLGHDYNVRAPMIGHTWKYTLKHRDVTKSNKGVKYVSKSVRNIVRGPSLSMVKSASLSLTLTDLYSLIHKFGPGEYVVASCRRFQEQVNKTSRMNKPNQPNTTGNARYNVLRKLNESGGTSVSNNNKKYLNYRMPTLRFKK